MGILYIDRRERIRDLSGSVILEKTNRTFIAARTVHKVLLLQSLGWMISKPDVRKNFLSKHNLAVEKIAWGVVESPPFRPGGG